MKLSEVHKLYLQIEYQQLLNKMLELERRHDKLEDELEKNILTTLLE
jgi:hypothetical protein